MADRLISRGSVVLIRYPFTDLSGFRVRPAIILTPDSLLRRIDDALCLFVSSVIPGNPLPTDIVIEAEQPMFAKTGLRRRSVLRAHKLALLHKSLVVRRLGETDPVLMGRIERRLRLALGLSEPVGRGLC